MSKPLPEWYKQQREAKEALERDELENRERILQEFRAKYDIPADMKMNELAEKKRKIEERMKAQPRKKKESSNWMMGFKGNSKESETKTSEEETTREVWEKFWDEEEETTGFYLPGFFEVFPELKLKWPIWARKQGRAIKCKTDQDCQFPQACCPHPILPGEKFCCTGFGQRIMVPSYQTMEISRGPPGGGNSDKK